MFTKYCIVAWDYNESVVMRRGGKKYATRGKVWEGKGKYRKEGVDLGREEGK